MSSTDYAVIIPARNAEAFLPDALHSVREQTLRPVQVVVVDDASTDRTAAIAADFGASVIRRSESGGPARARNTGAETVTASWIAFLDADDQWTNRHAQQLCELVTATGAVFASTAVELFGSQTGVSVADLPDGTLIDLSQLILVDNPIVQSGAIVSRDAFLAVGGYDESIGLAEDYDLWMRLSCVGRFVYSRNATVRRRMHAAQLTHRNSAKLIRGAWNARRGLISRELAKMSPSQRHSARQSLYAAASRDLTNAIRAGDHASISVLREQLNMTDLLLPDAEPLTDALGFSSWPHRAVQNLHCSGRLVVNALRGR